MKKDILKTIIRDFHVNPIPDLVERDISLPDRSGKIISIVGVRRGGKTSLLLNRTAHLVRDGLDRSRIIYINFEDERLDLKTHDLDLIIQAYRELYPDLDLQECYFLFDEIQNIDGWEKFVRRIYDSITKNIFITGSNSKFLSSEIATSLRGRTLSIEVLPLSFREYLRFHNQPIDLVGSQSKAALQNRFLQYLSDGGFPELVHIANTIRGSVLQEYFNVMLYRDMVERYQISNAPLLKYFLKRLLSSATKSVSINSIYNELKSSGLKIGKNQLYEYFEICQNIYLAFSLSKYSYKPAVRELGERKIYAVDNGLLNAVTFRFSNNYGKALEQLVFLQLKRQGKDIFFYKDKSECDFIVKEGEKPVSAIQAAWTLDDEKTRKRELRGLVDACKSLGLKEGLIVTADTDEETEKDGVTIEIRSFVKWALKSSL
ncbi:MAG TPA: ATPase [Syntrophorhabdus aromaticivorans]|nr:ATPase [Syntrophorhabdus aromaticivorans]